MQAKAIEYMLLDAFLQASGDLRPPISDCIKDPRLYAMLRDDLVTWIENRPGTAVPALTRGIEPLLGFFAVAVVLSHSEAARA